MAQQRKDYTAPAAGGVYYYRSPLAIALEPVGYAILVTLGLAMAGAGFIVALGDWRDRTAWRLLVLALTIPWLTLAWYQLRRLIRRQVQDLARYDVMPSDVGIHNPAVLDVPSRLPALAEPWATSEPEPISDADLKVFVMKLYEQGTWSKRAARNWKLPSGWCSELAWQSAMERLEAAGILGPYVNGRTRQLLTGDLDKALTALGLGPAETGGDRRPAAGVSKDFVIRVFE